MPNESANFFAKKLNETRHALAQVDALPQLSIIALIVGTLTGLIVVAFRLAIEASHLFLPMESSEGFESLAPNTRFALVLAGTTLIAVVLHKLNKYQRQMGVVHVVDRLHNHQGHLPGKNSIAQFFLGAIAVSSGHCIGREGPAIHLGAGAASQLGRWMKLPKNSMQTIIACGVASGISASFDTPLAGVIFAMEVIVMEYTIVGFVPVILSSVIGAAICKGLIGTSVAFNVEGSHINSLAEMGLIVIAGMVIAVLAGIYIRLNLFTLRFANTPVFARVMLAGLLTACTAYYVPEIMGLGYDTIQGTLDGSFLISSLLIILIAKLLLTPVVVALGIPGGMIGPSLFVGACAGFVMGASIQLMMPSVEINLSVYVLLGMTGMMAAVINAPLAALIAILELSHTPDIIFPAMLMIVVASLSTRLLFGVKGIFTEQLKQTGRDIELGPASRALRGAGVLSALNRRFIVADESVCIENAKYILSTQPQWVVFSHDDCLFGLWAADFAHFIDNLPEALRESDDEQEKNKKEKALIHLREVPGRRHMLHPIIDSASLYDALITIKKSSCEALYVTSNTLSHRSIHGIITIETIQNHYQPKEFTRAMG